MLLHWIPVGHFSAFSRKTPKGIRKLWWLVFECFLNRKVSYLINVIIELDISKAFILHKWNSGPLTMLQLTSLNIVDKWREITILQQNLFTEELLPPVTTVLGLVSFVQGEGYVYSCDTDWTCSGLSCSPLDYSYPRFSFELALYHWQNKCFFMCWKGTLKFRFLFLRTTWWFTLDVTWK